MAGKPVLWQIAISHYSEKARWALDYKGIEHERRSPPPGAHMAIAAALTRGRHKTFPVLRLDGENIGDSSAIIAAVEERWPDPPLYPTDAEERRRALDLEEWFDERVGPHTRLLAWHEAVRDPSVVETLAADVLPARLRGIGAARVVAGRFASGFAGVRFGVKDERAAETARTMIGAGFDRLEAELDGRRYLVGDRFSVADLTAAALFYPIVLPPEGPRLPDPPAALAAFRDPLRERSGFAWVEEIFRRHRRRAPAAVAAVA